MNWNSKRWKETIDTALKIGERNVWRRGRIGVYAHTIRCVDAGEYVTETDTIVKLRHPVSTPGGIVQKPIELKEIPFYQATDIEVWNEDTFLAAKRLQDEGYRVAALNMANRHTPGGGVVGGAGAQEENLFRRSNLFKALYPYHIDEAALFNIDMADEGLGRYPMDSNHGGVFAEGVTVFRGKEEDGYPLLDEPYQVNVVSVAAINRPQLDADGKMTPSMIEGTKNKIRTILRLSILNSCDALVLGAFGCGAFRNPPAQIARIFGEVFREPEFAHSFRKIVFAILDDHNAGHSHNPDGNFKPFADHFNAFNIKA